jgi:2-polyprenyl-3-methyl-5-hydroxy-6-metoxy-1,4-benzoquinol methylase
MMIDEIKKHNSQYYNEDDRLVWQSRDILEIAGVRVPTYIYNGTIDPTDHSTAIFNTIMSERDDFVGKKFLDIGTCAGINNLLLTREGFDVVGLDNNIYSLNAALYTMELNNIYYKVIQGDIDNIENMNYDFLLVNQMSYIPGFIDALTPIVRREKLKGRQAIMKM